MRQKLFYTADEITENLYTTGSFLMYEDGTNYIGLYHSYTTGETYTGGTWSNGQSFKLISYAGKKHPNVNVYNLLNPITIKTKSVVKHRVNITNSNKQSGTVNRYFLKKINEESITEVSKTTWNDWNGGIIDKNLYIGAQIQWYITGTIEDVFQNNVRIKGVKTKNTQQIKSVQLQLPNLTSILNNLLEFYIDTDVIVPTDINTISNSSTTNTTTTY